MGPGEGTPSTPMRSLERALDVLEALQRGEEPMRLTDVARATGLTPATASRILGVLQQRGFVTTESRTHRLGPAVLAAAHGFLVSDVVVHAAMPAMRELAASTTLTVSLYQRVGWERVLVARVDGAAPLRYELPLGRRLPLHLGAGGKAMAVDLDEADVDRLAEHVASVAQPGTPPVDPAALLADLAHLREQGFHLSEGERAAGIISVSVPVRGPAGRLLASLSASGPVERHPRADVLDAVGDVRRAAAAIGRAVPRDH